MAVDCTAVTRGVAAGSHCLSFSITQRSEHLYATAYTLDLSFLHSKAIKFEMQLPGR